MLLSFVESPEPSYGSWNPYLGDTPGGLGSPPGLNLCLFGLLSRSEVCAERRQPRQGLVTGRRLRVSRRLTRRCGAHRPPVRVLIPALSPLAASWAPASYRKTGPSEGRPPQPRGASGASLHRWPLGMAHVPAFAPPPLVCPSRGGWRSTGPRAGSQSGLI